MNETCKDNYIGHGVEKENYGMKSKRWSGNIAGLIRLKLNHTVRRSKNRKLWGNLVAPLSLLPRS